MDQKQKMHKPNISYYSYFGQLREFEVTKNFISFITPPYCTFFGEPCFVPPKSSFLQQQPYAISQVTAADDDGHEDVIDYTHSRGDGVILELEKKTKQLETELEKSKHYSECLLQFASRLAKKLNYLGHLSEDEMKFVFSLSFGVKIELPTDLSYLSSRQNFHNCSRAIAVSMNNPNNCGSTTTNCETETPPSKNSQKVLEVENDTQNSVVVLHKGESFSNASSTDCITMDYTEDYTTEAPEEGLKDVILNRYGCREKQIQPAVLISSVGSDTSLIGDGEHEVGAGVKDEYDSEYPEAILTLNDLVDYQDRLARIEIANGRLKGSLKTALGTAEQLTTAATCIADHVREKATKSKQRTFSQTSVQKSKIPSPDEVGIISIEHQSLQKLPTCRTCPSCKKPIKSKQGCPHNRLARTKQPQCPAPTSTGESKYSKKTSLTQITRPKTYAGQHRHKIAELYGA